jgi:hypothetical protein
MLTLFPCHPEYIGDLLYFTLVCYLAAFLYSKFVVAPRLAAAAAGPSLPVFQEMYLRARPFWVAWWVGGLASCAFGRQSACDMLNTYGATILFEMGIFIHWMDKEARKQVDTVGFWQYARLIFGTGLWICITGPVHLC